MKKKNKKMLITLLVIVFFVFAFFYLLFPSNEEILKRFKTHLKLSSETIKNFKFYKDRCGMHGPVLYAFEASQVDIQNIVRNGQLTKYDTIPAFANTLLLHIDSHNLSWWEKTDTLRLMDMYGKEENSGGEPHLKLIFVDKENQAYYLQM